jgi:hypothetical protein
MDIHLIENVMCAKYGHHHAKVTSGFHEQAIMVILGRLGGGRDSGDAL